MVKVILPNFCTSFSPFGTSAHSDSTLLKLAYPLRSQLKCHLPRKASLVFPDLIRSPAVYVYSLGAGSLSTHHCPIMSPYVSVLSTAHCPTPYQTTSVQQMLVDSVKERISEWVSWPLWRPRPGYSHVRGHGGRGPVTFSFLLALNFFRQSTVSCLCMQEATVERCWRKWERGL